MQDEQGQEPEAAGPPDHDPLLEVLVGVADRGPEASVTLMVAGVTIAGTLVGGRQYFDAIAGQFREATTNIPEVAEVLADVLEEFGAEIYPGLSEDSSGGSPEQQDVPIGFIHLKDVEFIHPSGRLVAGAWWRGRLAAVDGFILGRLS